MFLIWFHDDFNHFDEPWQIFSFKLCLAVCVCVDILMFFARQLTNNVVRYYNVILIFDISLSPTFQSKSSVTDLSLPFDSSFAWLLIKSTILRIIVCIKVSSSGSCVSSMFIFEIAILFCDVVRQSFWTNRFLAIIIVYTVIVSCDCQLLSCNVLHTSQCFHLFVWCLLVIVVISKVLPILSWSHWLNVSSRMLPA